MSQRPPSELPVQLVVDDAKLSAGHALLVPVQFSATSHCPADARQTTVDDENESGGHVPLVPVHISATSHVPTDARHVVTLGSKASMQVLLVPEQ